MCSTRPLPLLAAGWLLAACAQEAGAPFPAMPMGYAVAQAVRVQSGDFDPQIATDTTAAALSFAAEVPTGIRFAPGSILTEPADWPALDAQADWLIRHPLTAIRLTGYPDGPGTPEDTARMARQRASAAARHLIARGVDPLRIAVAGQPGLPEGAIQTAAAETMARRVVAEVVATGTLPPRDRPMDGERALTIMEAYRDLETGVTSAAAAAQR